MDVIFIIVVMATTGVVAIMAVIPVIALTHSSNAYYGSYDHNECDGFIIYECCNFSYIMNNC